MQIVTGVEGAATRTVIACENSHFRFFQIFQYNYTTVEMHVTWCRACGAIVLIQAPPIPFSLATYYVSIFRLCLVIRKVTRSMVRRPRQVPAAKPPLLISELTLSCLLCLIILRAASDAFKIIWLMWASRLLFLWNIQLLLSTLTAAPSDGKNRVPRFIRFLSP